MSATILLADDSPTIQKVVELTFAETPHQVVAVSSGNELLARLPEVKPDVVICDVIMPDRDGYDVCQTIKSSPETLHIPVILLTGTFEPFDRDRALAVGCDEIVTKPFEARQLIATVERLVSGEPTPIQPTQPGVESEEYGTYLVAPPTGQGPEAEAGAAPAEEPPAPAATPDAAFPPAGPEGEGGLPEEGLDFTTTGFAEMEAAGRQPHVSMEPPAEGLEIEEQQVEFPIEEPAGDAESLTFPAEGEGWQSSEETSPGPSDTAPVGSAEETPGAPAMEGSEPQAAPTEEGAPLEEPFAQGTHPEPEAALEAVPEGEAPLETGAAAAEPEPEPEPWQEAEDEQTSPPEASPEPAPGTVTAPMPIPPVAPGTLSDEDVDRIARRVAELFQDRLEQIAWEVIPDMAEIVVRERVREIEEEIEREGD